MALKEEFLRYIEEDLEEILIQHGYTDISESEKAQIREELIKWRRKEVLPKSNEARVIEWNSKNLNE